MASLNLDSNASYGLIPEVVEYLRTVNSTLLNPSSLHAGGQAAKVAIEEAREEIRTLLNIPKEAAIIFTSGATESNNAALVSYLSGKSGSVVTSSIEHPCISETLQRLSSPEIEIRKVRPGGFWSEQFKSAVDGSTLLAIAMIANNESGEILPIEDIVRAIKIKNEGVPIHTDLAQGLGKLPLDFHALKVSSASLSGHKIGALTGIGALVVSDPETFKPFMFGGSQELRRRAGTENVLGIITFGIASKIARRDLLQRVKRMKHAREHLQSEIIKELPQCKVVASKTERLPNTLLVVFPGIRSDDFVVGLDLKGVLASSGAACASGKPEPSKVVLEYGFTPEEAKSSLRFSVTGEITDSELETAKSAILSLAKEMQR